jgi:molybdenum cofactor cytidylyltransferase
MISPMNKTAIVLVASGLSRRFGRRDKMLAQLAGMPLVEHAAQAITSLHPIARVAVCPANRPAIGERLIDRFVIAVNKKPKDGLGHSIALGAQVALQFKPDAIMVCMGDMPFVEPWLLDALTRRLAEGDADIVHAGASQSPHPPTVFGRNCFDRLADLNGDDGAKSLMRASDLRVVAFSAPAPLLLDVDTPDDLDLAARQLAIRTRCYAQRLSEDDSGAGRAAAPMPLTRPAERSIRESRAAAG